MKTNSNKKRAGKSIIEKKLKTIPLKKLSKQSGFCKRKPKKIKPKELIIAFIKTINSRRNTYSNWANQIGILIKETVSKQAVQERTNGKLVNFLKLVLRALMEKTLGERINAEAFRKVYQKFKRIIIEDSTSIKLNNKLSKVYPGSKNQSSKDHAILKLQCTYELLQSKFLRFEITNFRKNDQGYSEKILEVAKAGDLVLRDLGYFVLTVFKKLTDSGVKYISRLRKDVKAYKREEEDKPIDLANMLKKRGSLDIEVFIGQENRLPVRLVAIPVEKNIAEQRRRKAKTNRDKRLAPNQKNLFLLGWDIFITDVEKEVLGNSEIALLYGIRWRIEMIFKSWKSSMGIRKLYYEETKIKVEIFIYCMLIFILLFQVNIYQHYLQKQKIKDSQGISMLKLMQFVVNNIDLIVSGNISQNALLNRLLPYYCSYELRNDRVNFYQKIQN